MLLRYIISSLIISFILFGASSSSVIAKCTDEERARMIMEDDLTTEEIDKKCGSKFVTDEGTKKYVPERKETYEKGKTALRKEPAKKQRKKTAAFFPPLTRAQQCKRKIKFTDGTLTAISNELSNIKIAFTYLDCPSDGKYEYNEEIANKTWKRKSFFSSSYVPDGDFVKEKGREIGVDLVFTFFGDGSLFRFYIFDIKTQNVYEHETHHQGSNFRQIFGKTMMEIFAVYRQASSQ